MDPIKENTPPTHTPPPPLFSQKQQQQQPKKLGSGPVDCTLSLSLSLSLPYFINRNIPTLSHFLMGWNKTCSHGLVKTEI